MTWSHILISHFLQHSIFHLPSFFCISSLYSLTHQSGTSQCRLSQTSHTLPRVDMQCLSVNLTPHEGHQVSLSNSKPWKRAKSADKHCMQILGSLTHKGVSGIHSYILIQVEVIDGVIYLSFPLSLLMKKCSLPLNMLMWRWEDLYGPLTIRGSLAA